MMPASIRSNHGQVQVFLVLASLLLLAPVALAQADPQQNQTILRVQAPLVLEDVVVLDKHEQPVHNLQAARFTVTDNGKPVKLQSFEEHAAPTPVQQAARLAAAPRLHDLGVNVFTNYISTPPDSPLNILLLDALNTPITNLAHTRQQMLNFLSDQPAGQRMAIFLLSTRLYLLQGFTSDPSVLKAAIDSKRASVPGSPLLQAPVDGDTNESLYDSNFFECTGCSFQVAKQGMEDAATTVVTERVNRTMDAFNQLAHYLSVLPGRKNVIWFSAAFPIWIAPDPTLEMDPNGPAASFENQIRQTDDLLARSQVTLYPADARGLFSDPAPQASHQDVRPIPNARGVGNPALVSESDFGEHTAQEHATLDRMARDTGGKAFYSTGDLKAVVQNAIRFGSDYYTMSFTPPSGKWDGKYHKIVVSVNMPSLDLNYRRGYFADDPSVNSQGKKQFEATAMQAAMLHGAPQPSELLFDVRVTPANDTTQKLASGSHPDPKLMQPPYRSYRLDTLLDIHNLQMARNSNGEYQGTLELTVLVYNADGDVVNAETRLVPLLLPPARYADLLAHGLTGSGAIDVPVNGAYFIRIGMHDPASNHVGAVEIPVGALKPQQAMIHASTNTPASK